MIGAVDIGGTKIATGLVDAAGRVRGRADFPTRAAGPGAAFSRIVAGLRDACRQGGASLSGVGVACTGPIDPVAGTVGRVDLLPGWEGFDLVGPLRDEFRVPVTLENDAASAALAEAHWGVGRGSTRFLYVTVSTGIGGGIVLDGRLYRGVAGSHPEIGHHVVDPSGPRCYCGARGCWEALASGKALVEWARANASADDPLPDDLSAEGLCRGAERGEPLAVRALEREGFYLGLGLANLMTILCPETIALGGGLIQSAHLFLPHARRVIGESCGLVPAAKMALNIASLGADVALLGAARVWQCGFGTGEGD